MGKSELRRNQMSTLYLTSEHDATSREKKCAIKAFSRCYLAIFVFLIFVTFSALAVQIGILMIFGRAQGYSIISSYYFRYALQVVVVYILGFPLFMLLNLGVGRAISIKQKMGLGSFLIYFMMGMLAMQAGSYISRVITDYLYSLFPTLAPSGGGTVENFVGGVPIWLIFIVVVVIGPFFEELMFRKVMFDRLSIYGNRLAILVSSVAFGLFHGNMEQLIYATGIGIILGIVYSNTGDVKYPVFLHMLFNFFGVFPSLAAEYCEKKLSLLSKSDPSYFALSAIYTLIPIFLSMLLSGLVIAGLVMLIIKLVKRKLFPSRECQIRLSGKTFRRAVFFNVGAILFAVYSMIEIFIPRFTTYIYNIFDPFIK